MKNKELLKELIQKNYYKIKKKYKQDKTIIDVRGLNCEDKLHNDLLIVLEKYELNPLINEDKTIEDIFKFLKTEKENTVVKRQINTIPIEFLIEDNNDDE